LTLLTVLKGLPLAYNRDLQEDKQPYFEAVDSVHASLGVAAEMLASLELRIERLAAAAAGGYSTATDLADALARRGLPFREAHGVTGAVVNAAEAREIERLSDFPPEQLAGFHPLLAQDQPDLSVGASLSSRELPGGTGPAAVQAAWDQAVRGLPTQRAWVAARRARLPSVERLAVSELTPSGFGAP
jgi:argininosuccinate lyase